MTHKQEGDHDDVDEKSVDSRDFSLFDHDDDSMFFAFTDGNSQSQSTYLNESTKSGYADADDNNEMVQGRM